MAELVCPAGHQAVSVPGDGKDYAGVCDVCGLKLKVNAVNPVAEEYTHPYFRREVRESRTPAGGGAPTFEQLGHTEPKAVESGT